MSTKPVTGPAEVDACMGFGALSWSSVADTFKISSLATEDLLCTAQLVLWSDSRLIIACSLRSFMYTLVQADWHRFQAHVQRLKLGV